MVLLPFVREGQTEGVKKRLPVGLYSSISDIVTFVVDVEVLIVFR